MAFWVAWYAETVLHQMSRVRKPIALKELRTSRAKGRSKFYHAIACDLYSLSDAIDGLSKDQLMAKLPSPLELLVSQNTTKEV